MRIVRSILRRMVRMLASKKVISARQAAVWLHYERLGRFPNVDNPRDLNEKILWLEFNSDTSLWPMLADKLRARDFVAGKGLGEIVVPLLASYESASDIDFSKLPDSFVIKSNNGNAQAVIVHDKSKADLVKIIKQAARWLDSKFGLAGAEPHYLAIPPRIIVEKLLPPDSDGEMPIDYKVMCFNGKPVYCLVCSRRDPISFHTLFSLYSLPDWSKLPDAIVSSQQESVELPAPPHLNEMIRYATILAKDFPFVRIDFFDTGGKVWFGEITLTPAAGRIDYLSRSYLELMGDLIHLPKSMLDLNE